MAKCGGAFLFLFFKVEHSYHTSCHCTPGQISERTGTALGRLVETWNCFVCDIPNWNPPSTMC
jgi:hypothetical protein